MVGVTMTVTFFLSFFFFALATNTNAQHFALQFWSLTSPTIMYVNVAHHLHSQSILFFFHEFIRCVFCPTRQALPLPRLSAFPPFAGSSTRAENFDLHDLALTRIVVIKGARSYGPSSVQSITKACLKAPFLLLLLELFECWA
jgi:hypothetical protein